MEDNDLVSGLYPQEPKQPFIVATFGLRKDQWIYEKCLKSTWLMEGKWRWIFMVKHRYLTKQRRKTLCKDKQVCAKERSTILMLSLIIESLELLVLIFIAVMIYAIGDQLSKRWV